MSLHARVYLMLMLKQQREARYSRCCGVLLCSLVLFVPPAVLCWGGTGGVASIEAHLWLIVGMCSYMEQAWTLSAGQLVHSLVSGSPQ